jgi:hypothetical protein
MLAGSFRLVTARLIPGAFRAKQALVALTVIILAGCGGSSAAKQQWVSVDGGGFRFQAPKGWTVARVKTRTAAVHDSELVQVATFPLVKPYSDGLFDQVARELSVRMQALASETGGKVTGTSTVTAGGIRSHAYDVTVGDHVDQYTFVLRGKREYQLLCRRKSSSGDGFCKQLLASFEPA